MKDFDANTVQSMALLLHDYAIPPDRAADIATEINGYLQTLDKLRFALEFDNAPADFERFLQEQSGQ
jgi:hypothetical protein